MSDKEGAVCRKAACRVDVGFRAQEDAFRADLFRVVASGKKGCCDLFCLFIGLRGDWR